MKRKVTMTTAAWMAALGLLAASYDVTAISVVLVHLKHAWDLSVRETANLTAAPLVGSVIGSLAAGLFADRFGRRRLLMVDFGAFVVAAGLAALATGYDSLLLWRTVMGLGIGADFAVAFPYLLETVQPMKRGATMAFVLLINDVGQVLAYGVGSYLVSQGADGFRWVLAVGAVLGAAVLLGRRALPESEPWRKERLQSFAGVGRRVLRLKELKTAGSSAILWFLHQVTGQGLTLFLPVIISLLWNETASQSGTTSILVKLLSLGAGVLTVYVIDAWGRRPLQLAGFLGRGLALLPLGVAVLLGYRMPFWVAGTLLAVALAFGAMGPDKTTVITTSERFSTAIRSTGQGESEMVGRLGGVFGVLLFGFFGRESGLGETILVFAAVALLGALLTALTLPETAPSRVPAVEPQALGIE
ncbi:MAG: MFS transporter [Firmicutes bacterium]|nr:MFS transporter [Bacillota bacterium]